MKIKKHLFHMRTKILILCIGISLSALLLQTFLYYRTSSTLIYQQAKEENLRLLENMQTEIESYLKNVENSLLRLYNVSDFIKDLRRGHSAEELKGKWHRLAYNTINSEFDTSMGVVALYLYTADHEIISTYRKAATPKHNYPVDIFDGTQDTNAEAVKRYVESDDSVMMISSYYNVYRGRNLGRFVIKLYDNGNISRMIGYAVCDIDTKVLRSLMKKYTAGDETYVWLQPLGDRAIISTGTLQNQDVPYYEEVSDRIQKQEGTQSAVMEQKHRVIFHAAQDDYNMGGYALMQQSLLQKNQNALNRSLILIGAVMCLSAVVLALWVSRGLTRPLERITKTVIRIKGGETELRIHELPGDEIGKLGQNFNEMLDQIEGLIAREYEAQLSTNRAKYHALQAQINPHFLYNTLETMSSIAELQECYEVSTLCLSLSNLFRYSLDMKNPFSTVSKEIVHLKNYIYVMNVRMRSEVNYSFEIDPEVLQDTLPRISIQPLVENAINHGLKNARGEKNIMIGAHAEAEQLVITVEDNGVGISKEKLQDLLTADSEQNASIGLTNIHSRMKMLYGAEYGVVIKSEEGKGTKVSLRIPRRKMEEVELWKTKDIRS